MSDWPYGPKIVTVREIIDGAQHVQAGLPDGRWVPARTIGVQSLKNRIRATWLVWTGRADALIWEGQ